jgi:hypothetical protein
MKHVSQPTDECAGERPGLLDILRTVAVLLAAGASAAVMVIGR